MDPLNYIPPVAIGGVGGSGTRLIANILMEIGFDIGTDLNPSLDNLAFTLLFKRANILELSNPDFEQRVTIFIKHMCGTGDFSEQEKLLIRHLGRLEESGHTVEWMQERALLMLSTQKRYQPGRRWGWKEPNTHISMERLYPLLPNMKYIHVMRNGLDMAFSSNKNQLTLWGPKFIGPACENTPFYALKYWHIVHKRILEISRPFQSNFLLLNYDNLVMQTGNDMENLLNFLGVPLTQKLIEAVQPLIQKNESIGRFSMYDLSQFDPADIAFVEELGFQTQYHK